MTENLKCLPFVGGWAEQPEYISQIINLFRVEEDRWEQEEQEKQTNKQ